jgi:hypothetical protein
MKQARHAGGQPTGGRFATMTHGEGGSLAVSPAQFYGDQLQEHWGRFTTARDNMAQSSLETLAASLERDYPEGSSVFLSVDPKHPTWMKLTGIRTPDGKRIDDTEFTAWKHDSDSDISPLEAAEYLPADDSPWQDLATQVPDEDAANPAVNEWYVDFAAVKALKEQAA